LNTEAICKRVSLIKERDNVTVEIKARRPPVGLIFLSIWLLIWTLLGIPSMMALFEAGDKIGSVIIWLCFWFAAEFFVSWALMWIAFGIESVSIAKDSNRFNHIRKLFGIKLTNKTFSIGELSNLRPFGPFGVARKSHPLANFGLGGGSVAVEIGARAYQFGIYLDEDEAIAIVDQLKPHINA
jgi:hypothetical protein